MTASLPRRLRAFRFRSLRSRLAVLFAGLFAISLLAVALVAQAIVAHTAERSAMAELSASGTVYDRLWALRQQSIASTADVLARDPGFRRAVESGDRDAIGSALASLRTRAGVSDAMVVENSGRVIGTGPLADAVGALPFTIRKARSVVVVVGATVYRVVLSPVMSPSEIGWVAFAVRLDQGEMDALEELSSVPLRATVLRRTADGHWRSDDAAVPQSPALDALVAGAARTRTLATLALPDGDAFVTAKPLRGADDTLLAALLIRYPRDLAFAPYRPLELGIALAGLAGLLLVVVGSIRLARSIARPIVDLGAAAQALEEGDRSEVSVDTADEIGRLADSFNRMSAGIVERERRITHMAFHDSLTGLPNRTALRQMLDQAIARATRNGGPVAVLCLDLDGFKGVNDTLGHPVGDALLRRIGTILTNLAPEAFVARLGGDEFAVILADGFDGDRPRSLGQAIVDRLAEPLQVDGHQVVTGTSIGIAIAPDDGFDPDTLLKHADLALYRAKQQGRAAFCFFEPALDEEARLRRELELDLRIALQTGQFVLHYQPIVDLHSGRVGCFEALLRWNHPTRGLVSPAEFIPVAEETGMIVGIGEWVLHEACRAAIAWPDHVRVAVNVSPLQFRSPGLQATVVQALWQSGLAANRLEVEITESIFLDGEDAVVGLLHRLRTIGVRVALDDFGTGYSSLSYLRRFPFDKLKIDRAFVTAIATDAGAAAIIRAIVALATALAMETTAEGVEDADQLACLRGQGCGSIQGFLFSRPLTLDDATSYATRPALAA